MRFVSKKPLLALALLFVIAALGSLLVPLPKPMVDAPYSTMLLDENGEFMGAKIASDEQWRFPLHEALNSKYKAAVTRYEDKRFYAHWGIDIKALFRALYTDIKQGSIVSGGSTITMQLARIILQNPNRTVWQKIKEMHLALRIELHYSKEEILRIYAAHAPFGGNTVGISAASWRYFGRSSTQLSWAEAALLAVLPNSPSLIHLSRSREALKAKRNGLLYKLFEEGMLSKQDLALSEMEPLPHRPKRIPNRSNFYMQRVLKTHPELAMIQSSIDNRLQRQVRQTAQSHIRRLADEGVHNLAVVVIENKTMKVKAYVGNQAYLNRELYASRMDITGRPRSTGSTLKPLLYAKALDAGLITPITLLKDIPSYYGGYSPTNYDESYRGVVSAKDALVKSLNVPIVRLLDTYGYKALYHDLKKFGMSTLIRDADGYGLSLILGGAETTLYDLTAIYANIAAIAQGWHNRQFMHPKLLRDESDRYLGPSPLSQGAAYLTLDAIKGLRRPGIEGILSSIAQRKEIAWKTGTSYGLRDAWAVGTTPKYTVGVWAGNATGEGSASISGVNTAGPVMFEIFGYLNSGSAFEKPPYQLKDIEVCKQDGYISTNACDTAVVEIPIKSHFTKISPFMKWIHLDKKTGLQVNAGCENPQNMLHQNYFTLPPNVAYYYNRAHGDYQGMPKFRKDCLALQETAKAVEISYPTPGHAIYLPQELDGSFQKVVLKARHQNSTQKLYWHLDDKYLGETAEMHEMSLFMKPGKHRLLVMDRDGNRAMRSFNVLSKGAVY